MRIVIAASLLALPLLALPPARAQEPAAGTAKDWDAMVDKALAYLKKSQDENGGWSEKRSPGISGVILTGILETGKVSPDDEMPMKALKYIESLVNPKAGHIAGQDPKPQLQNYVTSVNVMALQAAKSDKYKTVIADAAKFLKQLQWDEGEGKNADSDFYGGAGYDSKSRPDLSNTQFFLDALKAAGVPPEDPAYKKALIFVSRCQNLKSEYNDQPWAGKINDGSFIYSPAAGGQTKVQDKPNPDGGLPGYGSMTYAGIKSMIYCGVSKDDPRMKKALDWIKANYSVDMNPGMPKLIGERGLYYYYHTMAKCLDLLEVDTLEDNKGVKHDWRAEITGALAKRQKPDGSWVNEADQWMEGDPHLVTGYALMALAHCKPKK
ncbi:MAG TPA: prenyltransferase/squalene oxidase repeat-containing protein [Gemmataceae bacterium]|jgi:squalene-hopene/tetraprenyl-beta-curcumene cyclase|nr:prenyltransferase/squalene oxidase repeat-containing protein [Gemmataceae bacterium]